jgi:hypothetical protein
MLEKFFVVKKRMECTEADGFQPGMDSAAEQENCSGATREVGAQHNPGERPPVTVALVPPCRCRLLLTVVESVC